MARPEPALTTRGSMRRVPSSLDEPLPARPADVLRPVVNAMTVDVEEHFQVSGFEGVVRREDWSAHESRVVANTERLLELFSRQSVRGTFFILGWVAERHPGLVRRIADAGHEIGCHGYSHRLIYDQTPEEFRRELTLARRILQDASGQAVCGHRAASFSITRRNLWALDVLVDVGFTYDSSVFPIVHDRYGVPGAPRGMYRLELANGSALVELPPSTLRFGPVVLPVGGGGYFRLYPTRVTRWAIDRLNRRERMPAVVYVHPWEFDPGQPRVPGVPWLRAARHYVNLETALEKLRILLDSHEFAAMGEIVAAAGPLPVHRLAPA